MSSLLGKNSLADTKAPGRARSVRPLGAVGWMGLAGLAYAFAPLHTMEAQGAVLVFLHIVDILTVALLLALCGAIGNRAVAHLELVFITPIDALPFSCAIGIGLLGTALLAACALAGVHAWSVAVVLVGAAVAVTTELTHIGVAVGRCVAGRVRIRWRHYSPPVAVVFGLVSAWLIIVALPTPSDGDSLMYHILVPIRWLQDQQISTLMGNGHVAFVGLIHMLYLPLLTVGSLSGPALLSAALSLVLGLEVLSLGRRLFGSAVGEYGVILLWGTPTVLLVGSTAKIDVSLSLFLLLAHDALLTAWLQRSRHYLDLSAVLLGLSLGVKYQAGAYALALAPFVLAASWAMRPGLRPMLKLGFRFAALSSCVAVPWLLKNQLLYGVPFYPFFAGHPAPQWLQPFLIAGTTPTLDPGVFRIQSMARAGFNLYDAFLNPSALGVGGETSFYFLNPILLLTPLAIVAVRNPRVLGLLGPSLLYGLAVLTVSPQTNLRYLLPAVVPLTIVCTQILLFATGQLAPLVKHVTRALLVAVALLPTLGSLYLWTSGRHALPALVGGLSGQEYLAANISPAVRSHARVAARVNQLVGPRDTILMFYESRGLYLRPPSIEDTEFTNWPWLASVVGNSRCLDGSGIAYVLTGQAAARYYEQRGVPDSLLGLRSFERFAKRCLIPVYEDSGATLYRVHSHQ
jgi:4-amino-4-deoxy-L-arabinose transferase-like glycosyltransferase